ncbi:MAG: pimeloyl-ACP methyl ester carboxylesterase [Halioglobus sp.]|jgi:pimeloyl-ACP methyl ester carboxylesterase
MRLLIKFFTRTLLLILLLAVVAYAIARAGLKDLDQAARDELGGHYLQTDHGLLSYTREGSLAAPVVILVHGFSTPKFVWQQVTPAVLAAGYQVISFDHLGRGFSDRPEGPYDSALYQSELAGLIQGLNLNTPLTLVGYSMGGANVVDYAASHPEQIKQLVLIAPAGYMRNTPDASPLAAPVVGEWVTTIFGKSYARQSIESEISAGRAPENMLEKFDQQAAFTGYTDSLLSTLRHFPMADLSDRYRIVGGTDIAVSAIWGTADKVVPFDGAGLMMDDVPQLKLTPIKGANHNMTYGQADEVSAALVHALKEG